MDNLKELRAWVDKFPKGDGFPTVATRDFIKSVADELEYLRFMLWKLSVRDLATQHLKYESSLKRTYVSTRTLDFGAA